MLTRFDPFAEMSRLEDQLFRAAADRAPRSFAPAADVLEDDSALLVEVELPGVKLEDVTVDVENDLLTLSGERKLGETGFQRRERWTGRFARSFRLPRTVDVAKIEASLKDGVLTVRLPKREELKARKIAISAS
jgi:HSP20 family protein